MDGLRAERDEINASGKKSGLKPHKASVAKGASWVPPVTESKQHSKSAASNAERPRTSWFQHVLLSLLIVAGGFAGWGYYHQAIEIQQLKHDLVEASELIKQSKLLMARFEGQLLEADAEQTQAGSALDKQLKFLDSEMRKLWGVSNDRNKKSIAENKEELLAVNKSLTLLKKQQDETLKVGQAINARLDNSDKVLGENITQLKTLQLEQSREHGIVTKLDAEFQIVAGQLKQLSDTVAALKAENSALQAKVASNEVGTRMTKTEKAIESIDASRLQVNQRLVSLERKINDVQLALAALNASPGK
ncbi:MAG: hypothetical protein H7A00_00535 [Hahellaceae bacterium]|nr:hypothetical protein [Hahellaceae bacterium]